MNESNKDALIASLKKKSKAGTGEQAIKGAVESCLWRCLQKVIRENDVLPLLLQLTEQNPLISSECFLLKGIASLLITL